MKEPSNNEIREARDSLIGKLTRKAQDARTVAAAFEEIASEIEERIEGPHSQKPLTDLARIEAVRWCRQQAIDYTGIERSALKRIERTRKGAMR
jgi:hypothetical protein